ncbi:MAG: hypothetical protein LQ352_005100 [Teloschistes flavicans]|nr:MAG: hypothetical protein LQ352_005100 [Teloschistes flavicans]
MLLLTLIDIVLFSIGVGLGAKWIEDEPYADLGISTHFCEELALGMMFLPFFWLLFLLVWNALGKPKLHPGYYIGFDFYIGVSTVTAVVVAMVFSSVVYATSLGSDTCGQDSHHPSPAEQRCMQHLKPLRNLDILAYAVAIWIGILHLCLFAMACRVCTVYDREKKANKKLQQKGVRLQSPRDSRSEERIVVPANVNERILSRGSATQGLSSV